MHERYLAFNFSVKASWIWGSWTSSISSYLERQIFPFLPFQNFHSLNSPVSTTQKLQYDFTISFKTFPSICMALLLLLLCTGVLYSFAKHQCQLLDCCSMSSFRLYISPSAWDILINLLLCYTLFEALVIGKAKLMVVLPLPPQSVSTIPLAELPSAVMSPSKMIQMNWLSMVEQRLILIQMNWTGMIQMNCSSMFLMNNTGMILMNTTGTILMNGMSMTLTNWMGMTHLRLILGRIHFSQVEMVRRRTGNPDRSWTRWHVYTVCIIFGKSVKVWMHFNCRLGCVCLLLLGQYGYQPLLVKYCIDEIVTWLWYSIIV